MRSKPANAQNGLRPLCVERLVLMLGCACVKTKGLIVHEHGFSKSADRA